MSPEQSFTTWLSKLHVGDAAAVQTLWDRYSSQLIKLADARIRSMAIPVVEGEDVAVSVFKSLWLAAQSGRLRDVRSLDEIWWLLIKMTKRKCIDYHRKARRKKRYAGEEPLFATETCITLISEVPDPHYVAVLNELYAGLVGNFNDSTRRDIAVMRIEGYTVAEIAAKLGLAVATVYRKLELIRENWAKELQNGQTD